MGQVTLLPGNTPVSCLPSREVWGMCVSCLQLRKASFPFLFSKQRMSVSRKWDLPRVWLGRVTLGPTSLVWIGRQAGREEHTGSLTWEISGRGVGLRFWSFFLAAGNSKKHWMEIEQDRCETRRRRGLVLGPLPNLQESPGFCRWSPPLIFRGIRAVGGSSEQEVGMRSDQEGPIGATPGTGVSWGVGQVSPGFKGLR